MPAQIFSKAVGIDLGTTNSAVALMNPSDTDIIIHRDPIAKRETTPSCVWRDPRNGEIVVGHKALRRVGTPPPPIRSIKRLMGQQTRVNLSGEEVTPEQVSAYILAEMKRQIEEDVAKLSNNSASWIVDRAIVTVPAYFDQPQVDATRRAADMAQLQTLELLHEPTAAACYHCWRTNTKNGLFLVYDLGGGTFDVTVLRCTSGTFEVLGISGNNRLGGDDMDAEMAERLRERLLREGWSLDLDFRNSPEDALRFDLLKFLAEGVKKALSTSNEFLLRDSGTLKDKEGNPVIIESMFERPEVESWLRPIVERTIPYCFEALDQAAKKGRVKLSDVDAIILAGGSTHIPLVRDMVRQTFCADSAATEPRARCAEPVYEKVDTIVALGAAIRAAATGGMATYNPEKTVRVTFRGTAVTGAMETHVGGKVESLAASVNLAGGRVRLLVADANYEDEQDIKEQGSFGFTKVPLQAGAESMLTFEVLDSKGMVVATAGRPVSHSRDAVRPTGGGGSTATLPKTISMDVSRGGTTVRKELILALASLPANQDFPFTHPGNTELIRMPLYQHKRKIQEIQVRVESSLPKGTPIEFNINVDAHSFITVKGKVGDTPFEAAVQAPPDRKTPTPEEVEKIDRAFAQAAEYLPAGKKAMVVARYKKAKQSFEAAVKRNEEAQAVHDFEEMEELVATISKTEGPVQPPKEVFDELVKECHDICQYTARALAEAGQPQDHAEWSKGIEAQRVQGEKAVREGNQKAYSDAILMLENLRNHMIGLYQKHVKITDSRTDAERASDHAKVADGEADKVDQLAAAKGRKDLQKEAKQIKNQLNELARDAQKNPRAVQEKISQLRQRLEQLKNVIMGRSSSQDEGRLVEDHTT